MENPQPWTQDEYDKQKQEYILYFVEFSASVVVLVVLYLVFCRFVCSQCRNYYKDADDVEWFEYVDAENQAAIDSSDDENNQKSDFDKMIETLRAEKYAKKGAAGKKAKIELDVGCMLEEKLENF